MMMRDYTISANLLFFIRGTVYVNRFHFFFSFRDHTHCLCLFGGFVVHDILCPLRFTIFIFAYGPLCCIQNGMIFGVTVF